MSIVVSNKILGTPVFHGDIIVSSQTHRDQHIDIPSMLDTTRSVDISVADRIHGFVHKIQRIRPDVAVGWVGSLSGAYTMVSELDKYLPDTGTTRDNLEGVLCVLGLPSEQQVHMLVWYATPDHRCVFWDSSVHEEILDIDAPCAIGSGKDHYKALREAAGVSSGINRDVNARILNSAHEIYSFELTYGTNLVDLWGGFIESLAYIGGEFRFVQSYALLSFVCQEYEGRDLQVVMHPFIFIPQYYAGFLSLLRLNWARLSADVFIVNDILNWTESMPRYSQSVPIFAAPEYLCFVGMFRHRDGKSSPISFSVRRSAVNHMLKFDITDGTAVISFSTEFFRYLVDIGKAVQSAAAHM